MSSREAKQGGAYLSKEVFLTKALQCLSDSGGSKPRIDELVSAIGVTRGSFYWHFKDRSDFVVELVRHWHHESTLIVAERLDATKALPQEKLKTLMEMICVRQLTRHDQAVRNWALGEPNVSQQIEETEAFRLAYVSKLFSACGFSKEDAEFRATIFVSEASREGLLFSRMKKKERLHRAQLFYDLLMTPTGNS